MDNIKIILDNVNEVAAKGIFYVYNSKYYLIYTLSELQEQDYVELYVVQVCKEIQNTASGPVDTGYMLGLEINNPEEWKSVQESITKIVESKKENTGISDIQYLPSTMINNLKIVTKNKFKLMKSILENNFGITIESSNSINQPIETLQNSVGVAADNINTQIAISTDPTLGDLHDVQSQSQSNNDNITGEVVIDYKTRFFEEQDKNKVLEEEIQNLKQKIDSIKSILG